MADITVTAALVRPLRGAITRRAIAGEALTFGQVVYISSYSGDLPVVSLADANGSGTGNAWGVAVACSTALAGASIASGEACDVVVLGPVAGFSGMTSGNTIWLSDTAGACADAVSTTLSVVIGLAESPTVLYVRPGQFTVSS